MLFEGKLPVSHGPDFALAGAKPAAKLPRRALSLLRPTCRIGRGGSREPISRGLGLAGQPYRCFFQRHPRRARSATSVRAPGVRGPGSRLNKLPVPSGACTPGPVSQGFGPIGGLAIYSRTIIGHSLISVVLHARNGKYFLWFTLCELVVCLSSYSIFFRIIAVASVFYR